MASVHLSFPSSSSPCHTRSRFILGSIRCSNERQMLFNRIAPVYDNIMCLNGTLDRAKAGDRVLDLCCGSGDLAFLLSEKVGDSGKVCGLDFSKEQLLMAAGRQQILTKACYENIEWVEGDATDLPFSDCYFDAITMGYGLRNVLDRKKAMGEMFRVLKPGAKVSILDFNKTAQPFLASFQEWMIDSVVVPVASGYGLAKEYEYLKSSIRGFLTGKELEELALEAGFSNATHYEISGGLMGNLVSTR